MAGVQLTFYKTLDCANFIYTASLNHHQNPKESMLLLDFVDEDMKSQGSKVYFLRNIESKWWTLDLNPCLSRSVPSYLSNIIPEKSLRRKVNQEVVFWDT